MELLVVKRLVGGELGDGEIFSHCFRLCSYSRVAMVGSLFLSCVCGDKQVSVIGTIRALGP